MDELVSIMLLVKAFLTDGTPLPNMFILPPQHPCNQEVAADYARKYIQASLGNEFHIQDPTNVPFICIAVTQGAPGPAMAEPPHVPTDDEA
jgi:hypothetical protein